VLLNAAISQRDQAVLLPAFRIWDQLGNAWLDGNVLLDETPIGHVTNNPIQVAGYSDFTVSPDHNYAKQI
jgi:hypothetical protein